MPPVKVLFYNHTRQASGAERVLLNMLAALDPTHYQAMAAVPTEGPGSLDSLVKQQGTEVLPAPLLEARFTRNPLRLLTYALSATTAIARLRTLIRRQRPDLVHANSVRAGLIATLATTGTRTRILWHIHDDLPAHPISTRIRRLAHRSRRSSFVAVSHATARTFAGPLDFGSRMHVLHNGTDTTRFPRKTTPPDPEAQRIRTELGLTPTDFLIVSAGQITPRKALIPLINAFAEVQLQLRRLGRAPAHLAIAGAPIFNDDHLYAASLHQRAQDLDLTKTLHFLGARQDVPALLRAANLFVLNSLAEPFCLVLLESIASGTPILASNVGGVPELITDGLTGQLYHPVYDRRRTPTGDALADHLLQSITDPYTLAPMADRAFTEVLPRFTLQTFTQNLHSLYKNMNLTGAP